MKVGGQDFKDCSVAYKSKSETVNVADTEVGVGGRREVMLKNKIQQLPEEKCKRGRVEDDKRVEENQHPERCRQTEALRGLLGWRGKTEDPRKKEVDIYNSLFVLFAPEIKQFFKYVTERQFDIGPCVCMVWGCACGQAYVLLWKAVLVFFHRIRR